MQYKLHAVNNFIILLIKSLIFAFPALATAFNLGVFLFLHGEQK